MKFAFLPSSLNSPNPQSVPVNSDAVHSNTSTISHEDLYSWFRLG